ncbi:MAG: glycine-rich domain-containing protein [Planctomycetota bacterium]
MRPSELTLWEKLSTFQIGPEDCALSFVDRLARENGWSRKFARNVVDEYKRFLLLAVSAGHPVTPSDAVDQAWHLHLTYSDSYWNELCPHVLGRALHHGPTRGGANEDEKYRDWYARTLSSYRRIFGTDPPTAVWPDVAARFQNADAFQRVNTSEHFLIRRGATAKVGILAGLALIAGCTAGEWPFAPLILGAFIAITLLTLVSRGWRKRDGSGCGDAGATGAAGGCGAASGCGGDRQRNDGDGNGSDDGDGGGASGGCGGDGGGGTGCGGGGGGCGGGD